MAPPPDSSRGKDFFSLVGNTLEGKFIVECVLLDRGFSITYRARQLQHDRRVVLEVRKPPAGLTPAQHEFFLECFLREARALSRLEHPGMVRTFECGQSTLPRVGAVGWTVTEWPTGATLASELEARRHYSGRSPKDALELLRPVLEALAFVHEHGIAHRNVEPARLVRVSGRAEPALKLSSFALVTGQDLETLTGPGAAPDEKLLPPFSLAYAAPEQLDGARTGPWTDVHAAALVLTELLTDKPPYEGATDSELRAAVKAAERPTPGRRAGKLGPWEAVLERALSLNPAERYADASKLLVALEMALGLRGPVQLPVPPAAAPLPQSAPPSFELKRAGVELPRFPMGVLAAVLALPPALAAWWFLLRQVPLSELFVHAVSAPASPAVWGGAGGTSALLCLLLLLYSATSGPAGGALVVAALGMLGVAVWAGSAVISMLSWVHPAAERAMPWFLALVGAGLGLRALAAGFEPWQRRRDGERFGGAILLVAGWLLLAVSARTADRDGWLERTFPALHLAPVATVAPSRPRAAAPASTAPVARDAGATDAAADGPTLLIRPSRRR